MPDFMLTSPSGQKFKITAPEGATADELPDLSGNAAPSRTWSGAATEAIGNIPSSAGKFASDIAQPFLHPITTATGLKNLGQGVMEKLGITSGDQHVKYADAVGQFLKDRYGSAENIKKTLATDPVGMAADVSMILSGGGTAAARAPGIVGKVGEVAQAAGRVTNPVSAVTGAGKVAGKVVPELIGGLGTHTGAESIRTAARAGYEGGPAAQAFRENLRGHAGMDEAVADARQAVQQMRLQRGAEYRAGMGPVRADQTVLNFNDIDNALANITAVKTYKGQSLSPSTQSIRQDMAQAIQAWKTLPPQDFHTAEGLDALKQKIGDIRDATQYGTPERKVADEVYHAIRQTIVNQVPEYAKVMKGYEEASNQIKEIERTLSVNPNATIDTALRKLQSVLRDNVNTNYGRRKELTQFLINSGAPHLMEKLAGQALGSWMPRGLGKMVATEMLAAGAGAAGAGASGAGLGMLAAAPFMSPRVMGEAAYYGGRAAKPLSRIPAMHAARAANPLRLAQPDQDTLAPPNDTLSR